MPTRRTFFRQAAAIGSTALTAPSLLRAEEPKRRIVDCHTHFYDPTRPQGVPWPPEKSPLYRRVLPDDWMAVAGPHGVTDTIVIEASKWIEDNQWLLELAQTDRRLLGIIGHLEPGDPEFTNQLKRFTANSLFRGIRVSSDGAAAAADNPVYASGLKSLAEAGRVLDINGGPLTPSIAALVAAKHPDLTVIINHCGNPGDAAKPLPDEWKDGIKAAGQLTNVFCKISALVEGVRGEPGKAPVDPDYYRPVIDPIWESFGSDRVIYGSNWPVSDRGAPYGTVIDIVKAYFNDKGRDAAEKYFWKNSQIAYGWKDRN